MERIKEALGLGPGTFQLKLDTPAIPAGGFVRGTFDARLKKATEILGVVARATATRAGEVVYEQTQRLDGLPATTEARWTLIFRVPREIKLAEELLPAELRDLTWTLAARIELGLKTDPAVAAPFEVVGAFPDGVPTEPGDPVPTGTSLERVVNVLAADTVSAANRVNERLVSPHARPTAPDYEKGLERSSLQAELEAARQAQGVADRLSAQAPPNPYKTQILDPAATRPLEEGPPRAEEAATEPRPRRVEKPPLRLDEPIRPRSRAEDLPRRAEKPPVRVDQPIVPRRRKDEELTPRLPIEPGEPPPEPPRRRVEKPPVQIEPTRTRLPQPNYTSDSDLRWKKPGKKKK